MSALVPDFLIKMIRVPALNSIKSDTDSSAASEYKLTGYAELPIAELTKW